MYKSSRFLYTVVIAVVAVALVLAISFSGCKGEEGTAVSGEKSTFQRILDTKEVKIGIITVAPPYDYLDENGEPTGYEPKFARELGKALVGEDGKIEFVDLLAQNRIPALQTGEIDIGVFCMGCYPERAKLVMYSNHPYMIMGSGVFGYKDIPVAGFEDLSGVKVGVVKGTAGAVYLTERGPDDMILQQFDDDILQVNALLAGQVDVITTADALAMELIRGNPDKELEWKFTVGVETEHVMFRYGDDDLKSFVDVFILSNYCQGNLAKWWDEYMELPLGDIPTLSTPLIPNGGSVVK